MWNSPEPPGGLVDQRSSSPPLHTSPSSLIIFLINTLTFPSLNTSAFKNQKYYSLNFIVLF